MNACIERPVASNALGIRQCILATHGAASIGDGGMVARSGSSRKTDVIAIEIRDAGLPFHARHVFGQAFIHAGPLVGRAIGTSLIRGTAARATSASAISTRTHSAHSRGIRISTFTAHAAKAPGSGRTTARRAAGIVAAARLHGATAANGNAARGYQRERHNHPRPLHGCLPRDHESRFPTKPATVLSQSDRTSCRNASLQKVSEDPPELSRLNRGIGTYFIGGPG